MILLRISCYMAIMVINHIRGYILLIVCDINRSGTFVACWEIPPIIRRTPRFVINDYQAVEDIRRCHIRRLNDIFGSVYIRVTYYLYVRARNRRNFGNKGSNILIDISRQDCLDKEHVCITLHRFQYAQVIYITITVQVQVTQHIRRVIQQVLKVLHRIRLCKSSADGLQIQIEGDVLTNCRNGGLSDGLHFLGCNRRRINGCINRSRLCFDNNSRLGDGC